MKQKYRASTTTFSAREHGKQASMKPLSSPKDSLEVAVAPPKRVFSAIPKPKQHRANENIAPDVRQTLNESL